MLGADLVQVLTPVSQVIAVDMKDFDVTDIDHTMAAVKRIRPDVVIHSAAYTNVDACEINQELAFRINGLGARNVAMACQEIGALIYYISTDYVFNGVNTMPYREYDNVDPQSVYGKSKLLGERLVREIAQKYCIIRTSWLYGKNGRNFVTTMLEQSNKSPVLNVVNDQKGSPTYTHDLAEAIAKLISGLYQGIYHITNSDHCTWYQFAMEIFRQAGREVRINPISSEELQRPAFRPKYSVLDNCMWQMEGMAPLRSYCEALKDYLALL